MITELLHKVSQADPVAASQPAQGAMLGGAATTGVVWALDANVVIAMVGLAIAAAGFLFNVYFSLKRNARERERRNEERRLHALQIAKLKHIEETVDPNA